MKTVLLFLLLACPQLGWSSNRIDSLQTNEDVLGFLKSIDENFRSGKFKPIEVRSADILRRDVNCNGLADEWQINTWEKADFNGDGRTDLLVILYWYNYGVHVVMDRGDGTYRLETLSHNVNKKCEVAKPLRWDDRDVLLVHQEKYTFGKDGRPSGIYYETDTLVYQYGGFIELNTKAERAGIDSVLFRAGHCQGSCPVFSIRFDKNGQAALAAGAYNPKQGTFHANLHKKDLENLLGIIGYLSLKKLSDQYRVHWTNDQTVWLTIWYSDGTVKEIEDYGMHGTYGLRRLFNMFFELRRSQEWK
jgi:hypothetical protein